MLRCVAIALLVTVAAPVTAAQWTLGGSAAYFDWSESSDLYPVKEQGALVGFDAGYLQPRPTGLLFGYRGRLYGGASRYSGSGFFDPHAPAYGTVGYFGTLQEIQGRYRSESQLDFLGAFGGDFWLRELNAAQKEKYSVLYIALGVEYHAIAPGVILGARASVPLWAQLDANFRAIGFDQDPVISLGAAISGSVTFGYRFAGRWALIGFIDRSQFAASARRMVTQDGVDAGQVFQPTTRIYLIGVRAEFTR